MQSGKHTLVLADERLAARLRPIASTWVASWLLDPFVLVPVPTDPTGLPVIARMPGTVIGRDGSREVEVLRFLARGNYAMVRVIACQAIHDEDPLLNHDALLEVTMSLLQAASARTDFWRANLLAFPTSARVDRPEQRIIGDWVNIIAAPENRYSIDGFDAFVPSDDDREFLGHLLANVATAGALWPGMDISPYDEHRPSGGASTQVSLQRTFVRAVVMDDFLVRMARAGLSRLIADRSPFLDPVLGSGSHHSVGPVLSPNDVAGAAETLADAIVDLGQDGALRYRFQDGSSPRSTTPRTKVGPIAATMEFLRFSGDKLLSLPAYFLWRAQQRTAQRFDRVLHGGDGATEVVLGRDPIGDLAAFVRDLEQAEIEKFDLLAEIDRARPVVDADIETDRELWELVRRASLGMYDGQLLETQSVSPLDPVRAWLAGAGFEGVMPSKTSLFPDWRDEFEPSSDLATALGEAANDLPTPLLWLARTDAQRWVETLAAAGASLEASLLGLDERRTELRQELDAVRNEHAAIELANKELQDWLRSIGAREVSSAATRRLNRIIRRLPPRIRDDARRSADVEPLAPMGSPPAADEGRGLGDSETAAAASPRPGIDDPQEASASSKDPSDGSDDFHGATTESPSALSYESELLAAEDAPQFDVHRDVEGEPGVPGRPGLWKRFREAFLRFFRLRRTAGTARPFAATPEDAAEIAASLVDACERHAADLGLELGGLRDIDAIIVDEHRRALEAHAAFAEARKPFDEWLERHGSSFAWKLDARMEQERRRVERDLEAERAWLAAPLPVTPEEALALFQRFSIRLRRIVTWGLLVPATTQLLLRTVLSGLADAAFTRLAAANSGPNASGGELDGPESTSGVPQEQTLPASTEPPSGTDEAYGEIAQAVDRFIRFLTELPWRYIVPVVLIAIISTLLAYYRAWSRRTRQIRQLRQDVKTTRIWLRERLAERDRLTTLAERSKDVLRLLSEFLHRPFEVPSAAPTARSHEDLGTVPAPMTLAISEPVLDGSWRGAEAFEQRVVAQQMRRGWLEDAFLRLIDAVERVAAQPEGTFKAGRIDGSPRTRRAFLELIELTEDGPRQVAGRERERLVLRDMNDWELDDELPFPDVRDIRSAPADDLDIRRDALDDVDPLVQPLSDFILNNLPAPDGQPRKEEWAPWTISVVAPDAARSDMNSVVHGPARYRRAAGSRGFTNFIPLRQDEVRPVELIVRIDHVLHRALGDIRGCESRGTSSAETTSQPPTPPPSTGWVAGPSGLDV